VRIRYAAQGVWAGDGGNITLWNSQVTDSGEMAVLGLGYGQSSPMTLTCNNCLYNGPYENGIVVVDSGNGGDSYNLNNCTIDNVYYMVVGPYYSSNYGNAVNSIFADTQNTGSNSWQGSYNGFYNSYATFGYPGFPAYAYPFQTAGSDNYYLADNYPFRNAGSTDIDSYLLSHLAALTTYTPQAGSHPDNDGMPDLGYHYFFVNPDSDGDGLPDSWEMHWFGNLGHSGSDLDSGGVNTLVTDYQNYLNGLPSLDPNVISFALSTTNDYVNTNFVTVQVSLMAGWPSYQAVLINSSNFVGATWNSYTSTNLTVNLGSLNDGNYAVWVGLRGWPGAAAQTWHEIDFTIDRTPPVLVVTNPATRTVGVPLAQVQGYAKEQLAAFTFDVSNATGVVTGQQGIIMSQDFDTNRWKFTTNYFQCFDIKLTPGTNLVTLHATDFAGNTTNCNVIINLDYSIRTNLPVVQLTWPQDGMKVSGTSFTLDGFVDDPMANIVAQIVDAGGDTNFKTGVVERTGRFWVDNLPLAAGNNLVTVTVTDAAGHTSTSTITVIKSTVTLTIDTLADPSQLWQPAVNLTGTISGSGYAVSVNGITATVSGTSWSAANVPVTPGGVACFTAAATQGGQTEANAKTSPEKPDTIGLVVWHDEQTMHQTDDDLDKWWYIDFRDFYRTNEVWTIKDVKNQHWDYDQGGIANSTETITGRAATKVWDHDSASWIWIPDPPTDFNFSGAWQFSAMDGKPYDYLNPDPLYTTSTGNDRGLCKQLGYEHCEVQNNYHTHTWTYNEDYWEYAWWIESDNHHTYTRHAQTQMALLSGGRAIPGLYILHRITGWVKDVLPVYGPEAQPREPHLSPYALYNPGSYYPYVPTTPTALALEPNVPNTMVHIGGFGTLHDDPNFPPVDPWQNPDNSQEHPQRGSLFCVTPAGAKPIDATPTVKGDKFFTFGLYQQRVMPNAHLTVNGGGTSPSQPFRFWVNDDDDNGDIGNSDVPGSGSNGSSGQVNGRGDVIDFFPVDMHIGAPNIMPPDLIQYRLKGSELYYTYTDKTPGSDHDYLTTDATSRNTGYGDYLTSPVYSAQTRLADGSTDFNATFTNMLFLQHNGDGVVLMTASQTVDTNSPMELRAYWHNNLIYTTNTYLDIRGVEQMYRQVNLRNGYPGIPGSPKNNPDIPNGKQFVFVHGYNVNATAARAWNSEMFKRLYWSGSHAMFTGVDWQGDDGQLPVIGITPDYYKNVVHAFETAYNFARAMHDLPGDKYIAAHSLGNMVVSSAIVDWSQVSPVQFQYNAYFMVGAAVALEAYFPGGFGDLRLEHPDWFPYQNRLEASYWHNLFDPSDGRHYLTWKNRFGSIANSYNYYSSTEDVLTDGDSQLHSVFQNDYYWVNQEMRKGTTTEWLLASSEGDGDLITTTTEMDRNCHPTKPRY
jgi:hypothetical protein